MQLNKVIGYTRVSTTMQVEDGNSLENQAHDIREYCTRMGLDLVEIFTDEGISGKSMEKREGIQQALSAIMDKQANGLIVWKASRVSRSAIDMLKIIECLNKNGAALISIKDGLDTSTYMGKILAQMCGIFAEMERENIITQVRGGMTQKARQGEYNGGVVPLGYITEDKRLVVDSEKVDIVKNIFSEYIKGNGYMTIAEKLNKKGNKTQQNKLFSGNSIKNILTNRVYTGSIVWGRHNAKDDSSIIISEGAHEAIIDEKTFQLVQEMVKNNPRHHVKQFNSNHLLSGLLRCPECGYGMSIQKTISKGRDYYYYVCNQYSNKKAGCHPNSIRKEKIEEEFYELFERFINDPKFYDKILDGLSNTLNQIDIIEKEIEQHLKKIQDIKRKQDTLQEELLEGSQEYRQMIREKIELKFKEKARLEEEIEVKKQQINRLRENTLDINEVKQILAKAGKALKLMPSKAKQTIVRKLIKEIQVENGKIKSIEFKFAPGFGETDSTVNRTINNSDN